MLTLAHTMHGKRSEARGVAKDGKVLGSIGGKMKIHNQKKKEKKTTAARRRKRESKMPPNTISYYIFLV